MDYILPSAELPSLRRPTFIAAFRGWNDAGEAASLALRHLIESWSAPSFADIDPETFFDFTVARPLISITEEGQRDLEWPLNRFFYHRLSQGDGDVVLLLGTEPHLKWRAFTETVLSLFQRLDGARLVTLGAFVAATTHNRPPPLTGFATEAEMQQRLEGLAIFRSRYEGPTGIVGTLHDAWRRARLPALSLWVALPPYLGNAVNPSGAFALLQTLDRLFAFGPDLTRLAEASRLFTKQVDEAVANSQEMQAYVADLERRIDVSSGQTEPADLPPASDFLHDLEEFLRRQREGE